MAMLGSKIRLLGALCLIGSLAVACGSDDDAGGDGNSFSLSEWAVDGPASLSAGSVEITAVNDGGETHELVIVRADSADGWEQDDTGKVLEEQFAEADFIGEIEEFDAGTTESATFDLDAGTYVFFCNIVEEETDGSYESHFNEGMQTVVTVS